MSYKEKHDWSTYSDPDTAMGIYGNTIRKGLSGDGYNAKTHFKAVALSDMFPLSANQYMAIDGGSTGGADNSAQRYAFKARIIGENSPHSFLPDPCDPAFSSDNAGIYKVIAMHTTFISSEMNSGDNVTRGDVVVVELNKTGFSYDLKYGRFVSISSVESPSSEAGTVCASLVSLVGEWGGPAMAVAPTAGPATSGQDGEPSTIGTTTSTNPKLIYFYPGIGYGTKPFVQKEISTMSIPDDVILILADNASAPFSSLEAAATKALNGRTPSDIKMGGWSGGGRGVSTALGSGTSFSTIIYADPEPHQLLGKTHTNAKMYYRPENWGGKNGPDIRKKLAQLAAEMGPNAHLVTEDHDAILKKALKELIS
tara:strand:- start:545 stop:1648 length:1104 start_codon:yes stop_codon:yes gene_type:complete